MYSTTLRGVFPEPKPVYRRNFIKENVKSIKQMQGILQESGIIHSRKRTTLERYKNVPRSRESDRSTANLTQDLSRTEGRTNQKIEEKMAMKASNAISTQTARFNRGKMTNKRKDTTNAHTIEPNTRFSHRGIQTEREEDLVRLYDTGIIKYPSPGILKPKKSDRSSPKLIHSGQGDQIEEITENMENLTTEDKNFIKENKQNIKARPAKQSPVKVMAQAPPTYQRGVLPKYLRGKKEEAPEEIDMECPAGHILLPEEERKETLKVLRQSYADRIQELNMMPVRNDTLRMKKRKMEIEEELKRIDGGIKVFQRPKVYVKINA